MTFAGWILYALMGTAVAIGAIVSLSTRYAIRGWRNLTLPATYVLGLISLLVVRWYLAIGIWIGAGLLVGLLYAIYELWAERRVAKPEERRGFDFAHLAYGPVAWPLMAIELFENVFAEATEAQNGEDVERPTTGP